MPIQSWSGVVDNVLGYFVPSLFNLFAALIFFFVGMIIARAFEFAVKRIVTFSRVDSVLRKIGVDRYLQRAEVALDSGEFLGKIVYWLTMLVVVIAVSDYFGLATLSSFIWVTLSWILSSLLGAALILFVAAFIAQLSRRIVNASVQGAKMPSAKFIGTIVWWAIMIFGGEMALKQLGVDTALITSSIQSIIFGVIFAMSLALGLAFGLGGKNSAEDVLKRFGEHFDKRD